MTPAVRQTLSRPGWVLPYNPDLQPDFANARAWKGAGTGGGAVVPPETLFTVTRASAAMIDDLIGGWRSWPAGTLAFSTKGAFPFEARTNLALWCRDWTNAAWAKVTMTTALTATGIDGTANSATTITATGALSTILQTVVQLSTADTVSIFVRRRTGTGTIKMATAGVFDTDLTAAVAAASAATPGGWYRGIASATLVNPAFGLELGTSGDAVDVDFAKLEAGTFAGPPVLTTTVAALQAADNIASLLTVGPAYTLYVKGTPTAPAAYAGNQVLSSLNNNSSSDRLQVSRNATTGNANSLMASGSVVKYNQTGGVSLASGVVVRSIVAAKDGDQRGAYNGTLMTAGTGTPMPVGINRLSIGSLVGSSPIDGFVDTVALWPVRLPDLVEQFLTSSSGP